MFGKLKHDALNYEEFSEMMLCSNYSFLEDEDCTDIAEERNDI